MDIVEKLSGFTGGMLMLYITLILGIIPIIFSFKVHKKADIYNLSLKDVLSNKFNDLNFNKYINKYIFICLLLSIIYLFKDIYLPFYWQFTLNLGIILTIFILIILLIYSLINYLTNLENSIKNLFIDKYKSIIIGYLKTILYKDMDFDKKVIFKNMDYVYSDIGNNLDFLKFTNILSIIDKDEKNTIIVIDILRNIKFILDIDDKYSKDSYLIYTQLLLLLLNFEGITKNLKYNIINNIIISGINDKIQFNVDSLFDILNSEREYLLFRFKGKRNIIFSNKYFNLFKKYFLKYGYKDYYKLRPYVISSILREMEYNINNNIPENDNSESLIFLKNIIIKGEESDLLSNNLYINTIKKYIIHLLKNNSKYIELGDYRDYFFNDFVFPILDNISNKESKLVHFVTLLIVDIDKLEEYHKKILSIIDKYVKFNDNKEYIANYIKLYGINKLDYSNEEKDTIFTDNIIIKKYYFDFVIKYLGNREN